MLRCLSLCSNKHIVEEIMLRKSAAGDRLSWEAVVRILDEEREARSESIAKLATRLQSRGDATKCAKVTDEWMKKIVTLGR